MKVVSLVDNVCGAASCGTAPLESEHGLSLYIELDCGARVLFDMGQGDLFARNAASLGIDLAAVDLAVISHGHYDHAGGLATFLKLNSKAPVYIRESAFEGHFSVKESGLKDIGIHLPDDADSAGTSEGHRETALISAGSFETDVIIGGGTSGRLVFSRELERLPYGITLFSNPPADFPKPPGNDLLLGPDAATRDSFSHEQSMLITEPYIAPPPSSADFAEAARFPSCSRQDYLSDNPRTGTPARNVLFAGCAHRGIANILAKAGTLVPGPVTAVLSGMHIKTIFDSPGAFASASEPVTRSTFKPASEPGAVSYVSGLAATLLSYPGIRYYTMHCTGREGFLRLSALMADRISYFSCGDSVIL